jgi:hypothetical protein
MDKKKEFDVCLELLQQVVAARGKDPAKVATEYVWPVGDTTAAEPTAAVSLAPLLTGGGQPQAPGAPGSGIVPMPPGLAPPK